VARSGTIDFIVFWGTCCLYMTRLLKTPITGRSTATVDFFERRHARRTVEMRDPQNAARSCANAMSAAPDASDSTPAAASALSPRFMFDLFCSIRGSTEPAAASLLTRFIELSRKAAAFRGYHISTERRTVRRWAVGAVSHHTLTQTRLAELGDIDVVVMAPVDGMWTLNQEEMIEVLRRTNF
jgi:Beta-lactamase superfamily domain